MSNYPRDEFDAVEENSARHGVHRSSMEPQKHSLLPLMVVGVAVLCVGLLAFLFLPRMFNDTTQPPAATTTVPSETAAQEPTSTPAPTPTLTPTSVVNKATPVAIFNAVGTPGLAGLYSALIMGDGWVVSESANWAGGPQNAPVIFYSGMEQEANAAELGSLLNIPTQVETAELGVPLAVVLGPGA